MNTSFIIYINAYFRATRTLHVLSLVNLYKNL